MKGFVEEISVSSVLRPILLKNGFEPDDCVSQLIDQSGKNDELGRLLREIKLVYEDQESNGLDQLLEKRVAEDDILGVCLIGELFIEDRPFSPSCTSAVLNKYERYLESRSSVYASFSKAKIKLNQFYTSHADRDLIDAIELFNRAKQSGNITASIIYNRLQMARLREKRLDGERLRYHFGRIALFFSMLPTFWDSVEDVTPNRWWRYLELTDFMPVRVKSLDDDLRSGKANWPIRTTGAIQH
ncbi:hypothetical protein [Marinobacter adhaerens]|jgi:hypothetical protein|uniref:hypothetical protein n=1 Tax=Marinobacter adhaerens TaxID=1033846 RepID=UPI003BA88377